jgi:hypothetical protein
MVLLTGFLLVLMDIFTTTLAYKLQSESTSALNQDSRYILSKLNYEIYNADSVTTPGSLGTQTNSLQIVRSGVISTYAISNGDLVLTQGGTSMKLNGGDTSIDTATFRRLGNVGGKPTVQINLTLRSRITVQGGITKTQSMLTTLGLR